MSLQHVYEAAKLPAEKKCKVCDWYRQLPDDDKAFFDDRVGENIALMTRVCVEHLGLEAETTTVRKHVRDQHCA